MKNCRTWRTYLLPVMILTILLTIGCRGCRDGTGEYAEVINLTPAVTSTDPINGAKNVVTNKIIAATFNKPMLSSTIATTTFTVTESNGIAAAGTVTYDEAGLIARFIPTSDLSSNATFTANISTGVKDTEGYALAANWPWTFMTGDQRDVIAPSVTFTDPVNAAINVPVNKKIAATFNEGMNASTLNITTFQIRGPDGVAIEGTVNYVGLTAIFTASGSLDVNKVYTATINVGAQDMAANAMAAVKTWSFKTGIAADNTAPSVTSTDPINAAINVPVNKKIAATFNEGMDASTINTTTFMVRRPDGMAIEGSVSYVGLTASFIASGTLTANTVYTATIATGAKDLADNAMTTVKTWSFKTGVAADNTAPSVTSTDPTNAAINVPVNKKIAATFNEGMDASTINTTNFKVKRPDGVSIEGTVSYVGLTASFIASGTLTANTVYTATIATGAKDLAANAMTAVKTWSFKTGIAPDNTAPSVTSTDPINAAINVPVNKKIAATFNEGMDASTINTANFKVKGPDGVAIEGAVSYVGLTASFIASGTLVANTVYTATIATGVEDLANNAMAAVKTWSFKTGIAPDNTAPSVTSTDPINAAINVPVNKKIAATFNEGMDASTINTTNFIVRRPDGVAIEGAVSYVGLTAGFIASGTLAANTVYTVTIATGVEDLANNAMAAVKTWSFKTGIAPDNTAPSVTSTDPINAAINVPVNKKIAATFNEGMDASTINTTNFKIKGPDGVAIEGTVSYVGLTASFIASGTLVANTVYTATIATGVEDLANNAMAAVKTWSFKTGIAPDNTAPSVTSTDPINAAINVPVNKKIAATFNEGMDASTINTTNFKIKGPDGVAIEGAVSYVGLTASFIASGTLVANTVYTATIATGVEDLANNAMAAVKTWSFTTGLAPDNTAPTVTAMYPASGAINIGVKEAVSLTFSEGMDATTITNTTLTLTGPGLSPISGTVTHDGMIATFTPDNDLPDNTVFTATIATAATDLAGNELATPTIWTFKTGQSAPFLGRASSFALIASTKIDGTTGSSINGDVGVSPNALTSMTLSPVEINGNIYSAQDQAVVDAITDLRAAYDGAKLKATNVVQIAQTDIGGTTIYPGLYIAPTSFDITLGDLTIDAQGNPNAVFIFQMESTLTVAGGRHIVLAGNAKASNIYWQVGSSATLNTTSIFKGNIMANVSITVNNGSNVEGRLLAAAGTGGAGAVTFNSSTITIPNP